MLASHALSELPSKAARHTALASLWKKTSSYLVISLPLSLPLLPLLPPPPSLSLVLLEAQWLTSMALWLRAVRCVSTQVLIESGSPWGHMCMLEAREHITNLTLGENVQLLQGVDEDGAGVGDDNVHGHAELQDDSQTATQQQQQQHMSYTTQVVAPCPHMFKCPMTDTSKPCHFPATVIWPPELVSWLQPLFQAKHEHIRHLFFVFCFLIPSRCHSLPHPPLPRNVAFV